MILYNSSYFGLPQLAIFNGSAVYRTVLPSLVSTIMFVAYISSFGHGDTAQEIKPYEGKKEAVFTVHPFVITIYVMAYSLIINHRLNYCYQRYWESCSSIFMMTSKWIDSATTLASFHYQSVVYEEDRPLSFGDADKCQDQLREEDKNKSVAMGGHKRTESNTSYVRNMLYSYYDGSRSTGIALDDDDDDDDDDDESSTSSSLLATVPFTASLGVKEQEPKQEPPIILSSSVAANIGESAQAASGHISRQSFVSSASRHRYRTYSESDNFKRAQRRFSQTQTQTPTLSDDDGDISISNNNSNSNSNSNNEKGNKDQYNQETSPIPKHRTVFEKMLSWTRKHDRKYSHAVGAAGGSKSSSPQQPDSPLSIEGGNFRDIIQGAIAAAPTMPSPPKDETAKQNQSIRPKQLSKRLSTRLSLSNRGLHHGKTLTKSDERKSPRGSTGRAHRRLPSTDIPVPGVGGSVVKSFKPNRSRACQESRTVAMPRNPGLHSTTIGPDRYGMDFEEILIKQERERKQRLSQEKGTGERRRSSLPSLTKSFQRWNTPILSTIGSRDSSSGESSKIGGESSQIFSTSTRRGHSEPTRPSVFDKEGNATEGSVPTDDQNQPPNPDVTKLFPRLQLYDLPSLFGRPTDRIHRSGEESCGTAKLDSGRNKLTRFAPDTIQVAGKIHSRERRSSSYLEPPVEKMNGRASLFLQEAAHLYSLMSAVAMASLRADMEGVSSPLVDYVPGQKFPPVNPEEMQIKILIDSDDDDDDSDNDNDSEIDPDGADRRSAIRPEYGREASEIRHGRTMHSKNIRIQRNNAYMNLLLFLCGSSRTSRQRTIYNASRPFAVLGGISDAEVQMLRNVRGHSAQHALCCLWLREFITREHLNGSTGNVHPPIMARVYQYISDGSAQYNNCRKTAFTDFPFPHAQLTSFFGFVSIFIFPLLFYTYVNSTMVGIILNLFTVSCFFGIQEVALELEEPFIRYPNDLPLNNYQAQFNEALISSLYSGFHPDAWGCVVDNEGIFRTTNAAASGDESQVIGENSSLSSADGQGNLITRADSNVGETNQTIAEFAVPDGRKV